MVKKVYCQGVFDLFHEGHINLFHEASKLGDVYVGVHRDVDAEKYKRRPFLTYDERCNLVGSCKYVTAVIPNTDLEITEDFIKQHNIDVILCSELDEKWHKDPMRMNIIKVLPRYENISTTSLIERFNVRLTEDEKTNIVNQLSSV